jgi:RNA polymerase sigma-70 factor (ECF subfamily)
MPITFSASRLLAELPRLRRYARILTDSPEHADRLVEETLARARRINDTGGIFAPGTRLIALLRAVNAEKGETRTAPEARSGASAGSEILSRLYELPIEQREILVLVAVERLSYAEIASLLQIPVATVVSCLAQARETLRTSASQTQSTPHTY